MEAGLAGIAPLDLALASPAKDGEDGQREQRGALRRPAAERWSCAGGHGCWIEAVADWLLTTVEVLRSGIGEAGAGQVEREAVVVGWSCSQLVGVPFV